MCSVFADRNHVILFLEHTKFVPIKSDRWEGNRNAIWNPFVWKTLLVDLVILKDYFSTRLPPGFRMSNPHDAIWRDIHS